MRNSNSSATANAFLRTVPLLMMVVAFGHFNRTGLAVAGSEKIIQPNGITPAQMGLVYSAFLAFYTLAMLPGGWFVDRFGARTALALFGFGSALLVGLTAATGLVFQEPGDALGLWLGLLVVRSLLGIVNAPLHPASAHMVFQRIPGRARGLANGLVTFAACLGVAATYSVMGFLNDKLGWPRAFVITSAMTMVMATVWVLATPGLPRSPQEPPPLPRTGVDFPGVWSVLLRPSVICITISYAAQGYYQYMFFYWIQYFFQTIQNKDPSVARFYATLITLVMGVGMVCGGWLTDFAARSLTSRMRRTLVPMLAMLGSGVVFVLGLLASDPEVTLTAFAIAAGLLGACEAGFWTVGIALGGRFGGTTGGLMNTGGNIGGTLSPYLTPLLGGIFAQYYGDDAGWRMGLAVAGVVVIAGAAMWLGVRPDEPAEA